MARNLSDEIYEAEPDEVTGQMLKDWGLRCGELEDELDETKDKLEKIQDLSR